MHCIRAKTLWSHLGLGASSGSSISLRCQPIFHSFGGQCSAFVFLDNGSSFTRIHKKAVLRYLVSQVHALIELRVVCLYIESMVLFLFVLCPSTLISLLMTCSMQHPESCGPSFEASLLESLEAILHRYYHTMTFGDGSLGFLEACVEPMFCMPRVNKSFPLFVESVLKTSQGKLIVIGGHRWGCSGCTSYQLEDVRLSKMCRLMPF